MKKAKTNREEADFLGKVMVPGTAYYGTQTARAKNNFQISHLKAGKVFKEALGIVKLCATETNNSLGLLDNKKAKAIKKAAKEFIDGKFDKDFSLDAFQAGAGTSYNMNANEIIANRANELLGGKKGEYKFVHPNNHVNMAQSSNDVIPAVTRLAVLMIIPGLLKEIKELEQELKKKEKQYGKIIKIGRTHLQDAVPITFGQEFDSYKEAISKSRQLVESLGKDLQILGIGGTAVGTGLNTDRRYKKLMISNLKKSTGINFKEAKNATEMANNMNSFVNFSAGLRSLSINLLNFMGDLKLMNSGPKAGFGEIKLPEVQAGSSIMPGKVNPSIPECMEMICFRVLGNDRTIEIAAQKSNFELNVMCPIIMYCLMESIEILTNGIRMLKDKCIKGLQVNKEKISKVLKNSLSSVTALVPYIGYEMTAEIAKSALKNNVSIKEELLKRKIFTSREIEKILNLKAITGPQRAKKV